MNTSVIHEVIKQSLAGKMTFPQVVWLLLKEGLESYHVDLVRSENRYYMPTGESYLAKVPFSHPKAAERFSAIDVKNAIRAIQEGIIDYKEFLNRLIAAGCIYYITFLIGKRVVYIGRDGNLHTEHFPPEK